jgi:Large polyvalent protein associated domain 29
MKNFRMKTKIDNKTGAVSGGAEQQAADTIRRELSEAFPEATFHVLCEVFPGGSSAHIHWVPGPTVKEVGKIIGKHEYRNDRWWVTDGDKGCIWLFWDGEPR